MTQHITMKVIAEKAGVTQATVSMSLANHPRISKATRMRIQTLARKLGYQPNPYVSTLMRVRRHGRQLTHKPTLALVGAFNTAEGWVNHPALTVQQQRTGAIERASLRGYQPKEFWLHRDGMSNERFSEMLRARGVQGLLISPLADGAAPPWLHWDYFATVCLSVPLPQLSITTVCNDHYFSSLQTVRECHRRGYRRIGVMLQKLHQTRFQGRWHAGALIAPHMMANVGLTPPLFLEDMTDETAILRWLKREKPDVVITPAGEILLDLLTRRGWRVPEDIGLAWLACTRLGHPCSGVFQNGHLVGATAVDALIGMVERNERGLPAQATTLMIEGLWNEGRTLRAVETAEEKRR
jgi:DNA-binding LacI/PurR family transcriptional regulator